MLGRLSRLIRLGMLMPYSELGTPYWIGLEGWPMKQGSWFAVTP